MDFLFENAVIQASDLSGAGSNTNILSLLGKFARGMKQPKYFFKVLGGIMNGSKLSGRFKKAPQNYDKSAILKWQQSITDSVLSVK